MASEVFLSSVKKLTEQNLPVNELIELSDKLKASGEKDLAAQLYKLWIQFNQDNPLLYAIYFNYGGLLAEINDLAGSIAALERSLDLNPDFSPAYINLGSILERANKPGDAVNQWSALVARLAMVTGVNIEQKAEALKQIGRILEINGHAASAESTLRQSLEIKPNQMDVIQHFIGFRLSQCEWPIVAPWDRVDRKTLMKGIGPLSMAIYTDDPMLQLGAAWNYSKNFVGYASSDFQENHRAAHTDPRPHRLRIGYVSSDMRNHAVGFVMAEIFELHDRNTVEVFVYYCGPVAKDPIQDRIKAAAEHWVELGPLDNKAAARQILADGIDILIDVNGYTKEARSEMFAMRPAPVIVNWLGYPGSMGSPYHHYIIADDWIIPKDHEIYYSEKVMRLPCYQPNDRKRTVAPHHPSRQDMGLPEHAMVFCCFNSVQKFCRFTIERWMTILSRVPDSVLWLLSGSEESNKRVCDFAMQCGVAAERLVFAKTLPSHEHLARYRQADLFLDTLPYGAHVTASDALWMGVPILTFSGHSFASRVCGSLVRAADLGELVCATPEEYIERAVALGTNRTEIRRLKEKLVANKDSCTLFDTVSCVHHLEALYEQMWEEFRQGRLSRPDLTNLETYLDIGAEEDHDAVEVSAIKEYNAWYKAKLLQRHKYCSIGPDQRLWTAQDIVEANEESGEIKPLRLVSNAG